MNKDEILLKIQDIFRDVFDDDTLILSENTSQNDIDEWDSLEQINIISTIEDEFDVEFEMDEITEFKNIGNLITAVHTKLTQ